MVFTFSAVCSVLFLFFSKGSTNLWVFVSFTQGVTTMGNHGSKSTSSIMVEYKKTIIISDKWNEFNYVNRFTT